MRLSMKELFVTDKEVVSGGLQENIKLRQNRKNTWQRIWRRGNNEFINVR